jgi:large subunit ribosomal protein L24
MATMRVRRGDLVQVIAGKDRGKQGRVIESRPKERRVVVENLNVMKKHQRPRPVRGTGRMGAPTIMPGGVMEIAAPLPVSNVMVVCPVCNRPTRVGIVRKTIRDKVVPVRVCRRADCHGEIDRY